MRSAPRAVRPDAYEPMPPALYVYRQSTPHGEHTGIVCEVRPEAFLDGRVRGHESVQPDRVDGLARYLATVPQRVELVSTLHRAGPVVRATLARAPALPAAREVDGPDGSRHTIWRIPRGPADRGAVPGAGRRHPLHRRRAPSGGRQPESVGPLRARLPPRRAVRGLPARRAAAGLIRPTRGGPDRLRAGTWPARGALRHPPGRRRPGGVGIGHRGQPRGRWYAAT